MVGLALWAARLFVFIVILRLLFSLLVKKGPSATAFSGKPKEKIKRFKADNKTVVDADFKEL
jgi:hypothetical protein